MGVRSAVWRAGAFAAFTAALALGVPDTPRAVAKTHAPVVVRIAPQRVHIGQTLTIRGRHFGLALSKTRVQFTRRGARAVHVKTMQPRRTGRLQVRVPRRVERLLVKRNGARRATRLQMRVQSLRLGRRLSSRARSVLVGPERVSATPGDVLAAGSETVPGATAVTQSIWTTAVPAGAEADPRSASLATSLVKTVEDGYAMGRHAWIDYENCGGRIYTVPATQPTSRVALSDPTAAWRVGLQEAFTAIPIPGDAVPSGCSDATIIVVQPSTDRMWELWHARKDIDGWHADWGGATQHLSTNVGSFGPADWPGAQYYWGASASSMTMVGGMIRIEELRDGAINHALALELPQVAAGVWAWPAQRTDGTLTTADAIPYGARFRLDPSIDVDALDVPAATKVIARAAQRYGLVVREQTGWGVALGAEAPPVGGPDPYPELLGGYQPGQIMKAFPWRSLQLLKMDLRSKAGPPAA
jgi:hypothetical protein